MLYSGADNYSFYDPYDASVSEPYWPYVGDDMRQIPTNYTYDPNDYTIKVRVEEPVEIDPTLPTPVFDVPASPADPIKPYILVGQPTIPVETAPAESSWWWLLLLAGGAYLVSKNK